MVSCMSPDIEVDVKELVNTNDVPAEAILTTIVITSQGDIVTNDGFLALRDALEKG